MIHYQKEYYKYIEVMGVGRNDVVASSPDSYISYLNSVSRITGTDITPDLLKSEEDVANIASQISGKRADNTVRNYCSAMRKYVSFVNQIVLRGD